MRARDGGSGEGGRDGCETGLVVKMGKQKSMTGIGASLAPDYRDKEKNSNNKHIHMIYNTLYSYTYDL